MIVPFVASLVLGTSGTAPLRHSFQVSGSQFLLDGKPFTIRCGEMHYPRVPREYWRDRFRKMRSLGLNSVCTYCFWNLHEPERGQFEFSGNADVKEFVKEAQEEGLWVLLRPGPYSCAEWEWGGFPYWLSTQPGMVVRSNNKPYLNEVRNYVKHLGRELAPLQVTHGGPILMVQVENEYGSFGHDPVYKAAVKRDLMDSGFDTVLYTADGPSEGMLKGGAIPGVLPAANFGGDPNGSFAELQKFRPGTPLFCGEFYPGWFDSWGKPHAQTSTESLVKDIGWMEDHGASYSLYMVHGGTTFGTMNGANWYDAGYWPQTTSYDYSTVLDESGRPTEKYWAFRKVREEHLSPGEKLPEPIKDPEPITLPSIPLMPVASLFDMLNKPVSAPTPLSFEQLKQAYGFVLYRTTIQTAFRGELNFEGLQDRAQVFVDGDHRGVVYRTHGRQSLPLEAAPGSRLDILVENLGRINYGPQLLSEHKGLGRVRLGSKDLSGWQMFRLPLTEPWNTRVREHTIMPGVPELFRARFSVASIGDTFLDMRSWGKGEVWLNGHNLGRFWNVGPQQTLYVPGVWLKPSGNELYVWELQPTKQRSRTLEGLSHSVFEARGIP